MLHKLLTLNFTACKHKTAKYTRDTTTVLRPFVQDYTGEPVPEETFTHPPT